MKKTILWSIVSLVIVGIAVDAFLWLRKPQVIQLDKSTKLTLLGVTYGKHHVPPKINIAGRNSGGNSGRLDSTNDTLVVWIEAEHKPSQYPSFQLMVYDKANTACAASWSRTQSQVKNGVDIMGFTLDAFPRWDSKLILRVMSWGNSGQRVSKEQFVVANPAGRSSDRWSPDSLPDAQSDGDLNVTLTKLVAGAQSPYNRGNGAAQNDPLNKVIQLDFDVQQNGRAATNWSPVRVVTSDAAGNSLRGWINEFRQNGQVSGYFYQQGLWPDEPAWKLRVEFSRKSGFTDDEIWAVTNVPVNPGSQQDVWNNWNPDKTKPAFAEATVNGIHLKLFPAIQYQDQNNGGGQSVSFSLRADPDPESAGMRVTVLKATDDQGHVLQNRGSSWGSGSYQYQYANARNVKALNLTLVFHKSRFVEFTVKPLKQ